MKDFFCNPLRFTVGKNELSSFEDGEKKCYLLANGLGGFSSLTAVGSCGRNDHGLLISAKKAPNYRVHLVTNVEENLYLEKSHAKEIGTLNKECISLFSQQFKNKKNNVFNGKYIQSFDFTYLPEWSYKVNGIEIFKEIAMVHDENTIAVRYKVYSHNSEKCTIKVTPLFRLVNKDDILSTESKINITKEYVENVNAGNICYFNTNGNIYIEENSPKFTDDMYFEYDARDGRYCNDKSFKGCYFTFNIEKPYEEFYVIFSDKEIKNKDINKIFNDEINRQKKLLEQSEMKNSLAQTLTLAADKFIAYRKSTDCKTIMAGYPFFGDWGRDTMIALLGCVIATERYEDAKSILRTFKAYEKNGMMPNVFPEGENDEPMYNTADAALLFINSVYEYYIATKDLNFVKEMYGTMENIITYYRNGTDFHIKMDDDGLITAGHGLEQVTWMDVRFGDILPTPRQGKPVEINGYWYNALRIMDLFAKKTGNDKKDYYELAENKVKPSFLKLFWNEEKNCLMDVISSEEKNRESDNQIRPNQIWTLSMPFTMIDKEKAEKILNVVYKELYTPAGLRSLSPDDKNFHKRYGGPQSERDMAYHQGTVWAYPIGAYYLAVLRFCGNGREIVERQLKNTELFLNEGCVGQVAEIYDGENPCESRGCFAQAWSVGEILRVYKALE